VSRLSSSAFILSGLMLTGCQSLLQMGSQKGAFPEVSKELLHTKPNVDGPYVTYAESDFSYKSHDVSLVYRNSKTGERWWVNAFDMNGDGKVTAKEIHSFYHVKPSQNNETVEVLAFKNNNLTRAVYDAQSERIFTQEKRCNIRGEAGEYVGKILASPPSME
jgi:hypothetical protein